MYGSWVGGEGSGVKGCMNLGGEGRVKWRMCNSLFHFSKEKRGKEDERIINLRVKQKLLLHFLKFHVFVCRFNYLYYDNTKFLNIY